MIARCAGLEPNPRGIFRGGGTSGKHPMYRNVAFHKCVMDLALKPRDSPHFMTFQQYIRQKRMR